MAFLSKDVYCLSSMLTVTWTPLTIGYVSMSTRFNLKNRQNHRRIARWNLGFTCPLYDAGLWADICGHKY